MSDRIRFEVQVGFSIDDRKLTHYLLDLSHPAGGPKARFFLGHGFTSDDPDALANALLAHVDNPTTRRPTSYGLRIVCEGPLLTPNRTTPLVRSVWQHAPPETAAKLVTAYPL